MKFVDDDDDDDDDDNCVAVRRRTATDGNATQHAAQIELLRTNAVRVNVAVRCCTYDVRTAVRSVNWV